LRFVKSILLNEYDMILYLWYLMDCIRSPVYPVETIFVLPGVITSLCDSDTVSGVPRRQPHRRSGLATLPSVEAVP